MPSTLPRSPWGWIPKVRVLLSVLVVAGSLRLWAVAPAGNPPDTGAPALVVDVNAAPPEVLNALPRLGPVLVGRIVAAREEAPFRSLDELDARVRGIGPATTAALRPFLRFELPDTGR